MTVQTCPLSALQYDGINELEHHSAQEDHRDWGPAGRNPASGHNPDIPPVAKTDRDPKW